MDKQAQELLRIGKEALRKRCKEDLYFLAKDVLGYDLVPHVHGPVCRFFVKKDETRPFGEQDSIKQRLLLDPRGHFKTTLDICDTIQWMLVFPDVRILIMSGTLELAKRMVQELRRHFVYNELFRELFPEHCPPQDKEEEMGRLDEMTTMARKNWRLREPSVSISTVESIKAGSHYDIIKCDDLVNETNVSTKEQIEKTIRAFHYTTPILEPNGYRDVIGTRYDFSDLYGTIVDGDTDAWSIFVRPAWTKTTEDDGSTTHKVLFPERFSVEMLRAFQTENPYLFNCQYLNNPIPGETQQFTPELIMAHFIPFTQIPKENVRTFAAWDLGFSDKKYADFSVCAVGVFDDKGNIYILDIVRGRYLPHQLVNAIVTTNAKYRPARMGIEKAGGSVLLAPALDIKAREMKMYLPIEWIKVNPNKTKIERVSALESLLRQNKLWFVTGMNNKEDMLNEFTRFPKYSHDDIPDAIAILVENYRTRIEPEYADDKVEIIMAPDYYNELGAGLVG